MILNRKTIRMLKRPLFLLTLTQKSPILYTEYSITERKSVP